MSFETLSDQLKILTMDDEDDDVEDILVVGIDFGTTYSGVGWATRADFENNNINFITSWPGSGREEGKVPTELWYDDDDDATWGHDVPVDCEPFRWFKLLLLRVEDLDPELRQSDFVIRAREMQDQSGRTVVDLVSDYLRQLWEHIMLTIEKARGEMVVEALPIHVVITVPAIWKGYARQDMQAAVKKAGILDSRDAGVTQLTFAPEPEAAGLSTLLDQGTGVQPGNVYIVCDAGGGTVDLISYKVTSTKPIVLEEAVEGTGGLCGGIFIDQAFEHMCRGRLGPRWKRLSNTGVREIMRDEWEYGIKSRFKKDKPKKEYIVALPAETFKDQGFSSLDDMKRQPYIKNGRIHFLGTDIEKAFEGVFFRIEKLVDAQILKATEKGLIVTGIILVGGLGGSPYLYDHLKAVHSKARITVLQSGGIKPRTAICRGAVIKGFLEEQRNRLDGGHANAPIMVASTVSRASYGIDFETSFNPRKHLEKDKRWDADVGEWKAWNQMEWYLTRGELVSKIKPLRRSWYQLFSRWQFDGTLSIPLYQCEEEVAPTRLTASVTKLGTLRCNLDVQYSDLPDVLCKTGSTKKKLSYDIELVPSGASVQFVLYIGGRRQGSESAKIQFV